MLPVIWAICAVVTIATAVRARRSRQAARVGRCAVAVLSWRDLVVRDHHLLSRCSSPSRPSSVS